MKYKKIVFYADKFGHNSELVREWLKKNNVDFEEKDVSDRANLDLLFKDSGQYAIPVTVVNGKVIFGFDEVKLNDIINV